MKFSVIIPIYNVAKFLRPCLESVLAQTYSNWECICVDDGSTDGSSEILDEFCKKMALQGGERKIIVIHQNNRGVAIARNTGLSAASGDWITWLDADDIYSPRRLEEAYLIIKKEQPDLVRFGVYTGRVGEDVYFAYADRLQDECRKSEHVLSCPRHQYRVYLGDEAKKWGWDILVPVGMVWMWVARRALLEGISFAQGMRVKEDSIYSGYLVNRLSKVVQSDYQAYFYRTLQSSAIHSLRYANDCIRLLQEVKSLYLLQREERSTISEDVYRAMLQRFRVHCESDIYDWILRNGEKHLHAHTIFSVYHELENIGALKMPSALDWQDRIPMWWWEKTGQFWPLILIDLLIKAKRFFRKLRRKMIEVKSWTHCIRLYATKTRLLDFVFPVLYCGYRGDLQRVPSCFAKYKCETSISDLTLSMEELLARMKSNTRNEIRRAQREGCEFLLVNDQDEFILFYNDFCASKGLEDYTSKMRMGKYKKILITKAVHKGITLAMHANVLDKNSGIAFLLYSCSPRLNENVDRKMIGWGNRYLHFKDLEYLKAQGYKTYDWSGVSTDPKSECYSIGQFKLSFGGDHTVSWVIKSPLYAFLERFRKYVMKLRGR